MARDPQREMVLSVSRTWHYVQEKMEDGWVLTTCHRVVKPRKFGFCQPTSNGWYKSPGPGSSCRECR